MCPGCEPVRLAIRGLCYDRISEDYAARSYVELAYVGLVRARARFENRHRAKETRLRRAVTVLKSRASAHDPAVREFDITSDGIVLGDPIGA